MSTLQDVSDHVKEYCRLYNLENIDQTEKLSPILKAYEPNQFYPQADRCGVYTIYGENEELLYIGKASMSSSIGGRLFSHFPYVKGDKSQFEPIGGEAAWFGKPTYLYCFAVKETWEAASLEEYLIYHLDPPANKKGRRKKSVQ